LTAVAAVPGYWFEAASEEAIWVLGGRCHADRLARLPRCLKV